MRTTRDDQNWRRCVGANQPSRADQIYALLGLALLVPLACAGLLVFEAINRLFLAG